MFRSGEELGWCKYTDEDDAAVRFQGERVRWRRTFFEGRPLSNQVK